MKNTVTNNLSAEMKLITLKNIQTRMQFLKMIQIPWNANLGT